MLGNEEDFAAALGIQVSGVREDLLELETAAFRRMIDSAVAKYSNFKVVATTLRAATTATRNDWSAICWADGKFHASREWKHLEIMDRVGGGDSFASGLIYGLLQLEDPAKAVEYGVAHGALAMTTPGDTSMASLAEVEALVKGKGARIER
jgi:2-dehydro-3-deoxygluconokinase